MNCLSFLSATVLLFFCPVFTGFAHAQGGGCCTLPDNGNGTVDMIPLCSYFGPLLIDDGIPGGTIEIDAELINYMNMSEVAGGSLAGTRATFDAVIRLNMSGTGVLNLFNRTIFLPIPNSVIDFAPRTSGDPVQVFADDVWVISGDVFGDPDFDQISIQGGSIFLLPSPGQTDLSQIGPAGDPFDVNSFFDLFYRISFIGAPGSVLGGLSGTTRSNGLFELCPGTATSVPLTSNTETTNWTAIKRRFAE